MTKASLFFLSLIFVLVHAQSTLAQRRSYPPPLPGAFELLEPRTRLEEFEARVEAVLVTGSSRIGILNAQPGVIRVEAIEIRDATGSSRATGLVLSIRDYSRSQTGTRQFDLGGRALVDYEEIDSLIKAMDVVLKADDTITKHPRFDMRYRTRGDFEVVVFRQTTGGNAAEVSAGYFQKSSVLLSIDELTRLRHMIQEAKVRLDELK